MINNFSCTLYHCSHPLSWFVSSLLFKALLKYCLYLIRHITLIRCLETESETNMQKISKSNFKIFFSPVVGILAVRISVAVGEYSSSMIRSKESRKWLETSSTQKRSSSHCSDKNSWKIKPCFQFHLTLCNNNFLWNLTKIKCRI